MGVDGRCSLPGLRGEDVLGSNGQTPETRR